MNIGLERKDRVYTQKIDILTRKLVSIIVELNTEDKEDEFNKMGNKFWII
jgi:hypothetical protein|tara:strand:- start:465 stop:614 length:150 start_codon:yes stop_codon:yes gene_type:complete